MKNWEEQLEELEGRLTEWRGRYRAEFERLRRERGRGLFKRLPAADVDRIAAEAQRAAGEEILADVWAFFDELCAFYAEALPGVRSKIRAACGSRDEVFAFLWEYASESPDRIASPEDEERLRLALLALSIDDHRVETSRMLELLGRLYLAGARAGVDPDPLLQRVAEVSNPGTSGGAGHMQSYLAEFTSSAYFRDHVRPLLPGGRKSAG